MARCSAGVCSRWRLGRRRRARRGRRAGWGDLFGVEGVGDRLGASRVSFVAKPTTIAALRLLAAPDVGRNSPRLPGEFSTYRVKVRLRSMKIEDDSDIHRVIAGPTSATRTMIAEFPNAGCVRDAGATSRGSAINRAKSNA